MLTTHSRFGILNSFRFQIVAGSILLLLISAVTLVITNQRLIQSNTLKRSTPIGDKFRRCSI